MVAAPAAEHVVTRAAEDDPPEQPIAAAPASHQRGPPAACLHAVVAAKAVDSHLAFGRSVGLDGVLPVGADHVEALSCEGAQDVDSRQAGDNLVCIASGAGRGAGQADDSAFAAVVLQSVVAT